MEVPYLVHEIHSSEVRAFLECRQSWFWQYRERWEPIRTPKPLAFGRAWHVALQELYRPELWPGNSKRDLYVRALQAYDLEVVKQQREYLYKSNKSVLDPEDIVDFAERRALVQNMLKNLIRSLDVEKYTPIEVEQEYMVDLGIRCRCKQCWDRYYNQCILPTYPVGKNLEIETVWDPNLSWIGLPVVFVLRIDAVFVDRLASWWIVDHKSAAQLMAPDSADYLDLDLQMGHYIWALRRLGHPACGAIYNQFRKAYPKPPKELLTGGYSVNRLQLTDYWTALRTFKKDHRGFAAGRYDDYLKWLIQHKKDFFRQFPIHKTDAQLVMIEHNLKLTVTDMLAAGLSGQSALYIHPQQFICRRCDYINPCLSRQGGHDFGSELSTSFVKTLPWYEVHRQEAKAKDNG